MGVIQHFNEPLVGKFDARLVLVNAFDRVYELGDGSGIGVGAGPNVLLGGSNRTIALQPSSLQGSISLNVVTGLSLLKLRPLPM